MLPGRRALSLGLGAVALLAAAGVGADSSTAAAPAASPTALGGGKHKVPEAVRVPAGNRAVATMDAKGVQVYQCTAGTWTFLEPAAVLGHGSRTAIHFRGPSWESTQDGSLVEGSAVASSPVPGAIAQLLLKATRTRGSGVFGAVTYIQRLETKGGLAPTGACQDGETRGVPYAAEYVFFARA
ncbi:DUF3455 domain-containing protein [Motilibacter sp. E257]|uniref:DUF3455 domain-containing protein n=2 Tax=Motilibacter deserti TaxID=2714956 RepID=A0ABX0GQB7_9ACTN|nr:DUF3455 domain-containing protein [Motilibacter deserti]